jgi:ubiquinone/menaquinone biosynthesis C-methylase UbiE
VGIWSRHVLPRIIEVACGTPAVAALRREVIPLASGRVLEVGMGTGHNLRWYDPERIDRVIGLDPAEEMLDRARRRSEAAPFPVEHLALEGERIPLDAASVDTVVVTFTLCSIPDVETALAGMRRVLKPEGRLLFCEHGRAPQASTAYWQDRVTPAWRRVFGGCHLNRDIPALLDAGGFAVERLDTGWIAGSPAIAGFCYRGVARLA